MNQISKEKYNMKKDLVYIGGPITAKTPELKKINLMKGEIAASILASKGIQFFSPHFHSSDLGYLQPNNFWYELDLRFLAICDCLLLLEGWENSKGCKIEKEFAEKNDKRIFYSTSNLLKYFGIDGEQ